MRVPRGNDVRFGWWVQLINATRTLDRGRGAIVMYHRVGFTAAQSAELWGRWKKGEGLKSIGRAFGKPSSCIFAHLRPSGGIMPPARRRSRLALTSSTCAPAPPMIGSRNRSSPVLRSGDATRRYICDVSSVGGLI